MPSAQGAQQHEKAGSAEQQHKGRFMSMSNDLLDDIATTHTWAPDRTL